MAASSSSSSSSSALFRGVTIVDMMHFQSCLVDVVNFPSGRLMNLGVVTTGLVPLSVGSVELFQLQPYLNGLPWSMQGATVNLLFRDPSGNQTSSSAVITAGSATVSWTVPSTPGSWFRSWQITDANGVHQLSQPITFNIGTSP
jgi:hypothetical protein